MSHPYSYDHYEDPFANRPPPVAAPYQPPYNTTPGAHPESSFDRLRAVRRYSRDNSQSRQPLQNYGQPMSPASPSVPQHRDPQGRYWGQELGYSNSTASNITPGADNYGEQAAGGIAGIAYGVADANARESGLEAMRNTPGYHQHYDASPYGSQHGVDRQPSPYQSDHDYTHSTPRPGGSQTSLTPLGVAAVPPAVSRSPHSLQEHYSDTPYRRYSRNLDPAMAEFDPNSIADDGDDGLEYTRHNRNSATNLTQNSDQSRAPSVAGGAAAGGVIGTLGGLVGRNASGNAPGYGPISNAQTGYEHSYDLGEEKSEWLKRQNKGRKKWKVLVASAVIFLIVAGIIAGVTVPLLKKNSTSNSATGGTAASDTAANGDLNKDSAEIKALMGNNNLHKVFPGMDYTPINTQYPDCLKWPPSQNNVTRDLAVLSQLTNVVRLYGTDCNQTEMLLHSIDQLGLKGQVKVWLGVWQDKNETTNARQLDQMYKILKTYGSSPFLGVIVGNEVLFNEYKTETELGTIIRGVKSNLTAQGINLPVATSDLGDKWTAGLAASVDYVMANVHPFFSGTPAEQAASWTWDFWHRTDSGFKTDTSKNIISETGWPSSGGTDCGGAATCNPGSIAGISEMNTFMNDWVCQALSNGTNYFWFEAFDEPWKVKYDQPGKAWEDQWGLMDTNRNLKNGLVIPDCGGKTVPPVS